MSPAALPTQALEDWRYVDCRPLAGLDPAAGATVLPGSPAPAPAAPQAADPTHAWAAAGQVRRLDLRGEQALVVDDRGGAWALHLVAAPGSSIRVTVRRHGADGRNASWIHAELGQGATLAVDDLPAAAGGVHLAAYSAQVGRDASLAVRLAQAGGRLVRHRIDAVLAGTGAGCAVHAATALRAQHQAHLLTRVVHAVGATRSEQLVKAVLRDASRTSFDGVVTMLAGADGSTAVQQDRNLLLSPEARADTRPQLDIRADEVEASHGATVGALDAEELTYLRARGLPAAEARDLLTVAFLDEALLAMPDPALRAAAREALHGV